MGSAKPRGKSINIPKVQQGDRFLKGPIPWSWLRIAGHLPGRALHVGIAVWHVCQMQRSATIPISQRLLSEIGVSRFSAYRALRRLESAGLLTVRRYRGRLAIVTLVSPSDGQGALSKGRQGEYSR